MEKKAIYIQLPANRRLVWYLAAEEYFAEHIHRIREEYGQDAGEVLFMWVVPPTVIFGRHQVMQNEVNIDYCERHGIAMYRRKSGGGCVYADEGNLMISCISTLTKSEQVFQSYLDRMALCLHEMGYEAVKSTNNDILIGAHKVSGNACFARPHATIVHGTMLYKVDFDALQAAITPSREKLQKHGVESVRQRVRNLSDMANGHCGDSIEALAQKIQQYWCEAVYMASEQDVLAIDEIEKEYLDPAFIEAR